MPHLLEVGLREPVGDAVAKRQFPFSLGSIAQLPTLDLDVPITIFVGENGSGKSTLLEAIAAAAELPALGVSEVAVDDTLVHQRRLASALRLAWRPRRRRGFFLRAEDFFGHLRMQARTDARIAREKLEMRAGIETPELDGPGGRHVDEQYADRYIAAHDSRSHGESFLDVFSRRLHPRGLYLLDEPEAPLSPMKQLVLIRRIVEAAENDAQFIIATHSPILLALPGARIFTFDNPPIEEIRFDDVAHVNVMRDFLADPGARVRRVLEEPRALSRRPHPRTR